MTKPTTLVTLLLDRSSSMNSVLDSTIEAFNGFVDGLKAEKEAEISFTFLQFDAVTIGAAFIHKVHVQVPVAQVPELTRQGYQPRGSTPLIEAAFKTIQATEAALAKRDDKPKVVLCIQTDGEENCSGREYTWAGLKALIEAKQAEGWEFNFLGAGINAYQQGAQMGVSATNTMSYESASPKATRAAFHATATVASNFAAGRSTSTAYSASMRAEAGDKHVPPGVFQTGAVPASVDLSPRAVGMSPALGAPYGQVQTSQVAYSVDSLNLSLLPTSAGTADARLDLSAP